MSLHTSQLAFTDSAVVPDSDAGRVSGKGSSTSP